MTFRGTRQPRTHASSRTVLLGLLIGFAIALFKLSSTVTSSISSTNSFPATQRHQSDVGGWRQKPALPAGLPMEVYARGPSQDRDAIARVAALLSDDEKKQLRELCGRTLYHSLQTGWVSHETGAWTFVATGEVGGLVFEGQACANGFGPCLCHVQADLQPLAMSIWCPRMFVTYVVATRHVVLGRGGRHGDESRHMPLVMPLMARHGQPTALSVSLLAAGDLPLMWIRDSAVQIDVLLPRIAKRPALRRVIEGAIRAQAFFITQDPYANGYEPEWRNPDERHGGDRILGRGGWVGVRNYELDSGAYYLNLLWNWYSQPELYRPELLLDDPLIFGATNLLVDVWIREQRHNASSPYRYTELSNGGLGPEVDFTGMTWSGFRPSDDPSQFGFPIPANMYAAAGLERALELNRRVWRDHDFDAKASQLLKDIRSGIEKHGKVQKDGSTIYAYEVDGKGNSLTDFDDPNIPSLVSIPILGYDGYDRAAYEATRQRLLNSKTNSFYFEGSQFKGMGSPHTAHRMAWALGIYTEVLTASTPQEQADGLRTLLKLQCGDGLMHESVNVDDLKQCTRKWFEWANALLVVSVEQLLGYDCDAAAQSFHLGYVAARESKSDGRGGEPRFFQTAEAAMQWDGIYKSKVADWKGIGHLVPIEVETADNKPQAA